MISALLRLREGERCRREYHRGRPSVADLNQSGGPQSAPFTFREDSPSSRARRHVRLELAVALDGGHKIYWSGLFRLSFRKRMAPLRAPQRHVNHRPFYPVKGSKVNVLYTKKRIKKPVPALLNASRLLVDPGEHPPRSECENWPSDIDPPIEQEITARSDDRNRRFQIPNSKPKSLRDANNALPINCGARVHLAALGPLASHK